MVGFLVLPFVDQWFFVFHSITLPQHLATDPLGAEERKNYQRLCSGFEALAKVHRLRQVTALQAQGNWKQHAGASQIASFEPVRLLPPNSISWLETNIPVWGLQRNRLLVVFLPDCILVEKGKKVGAIHYQDLVLSSNYAEFMEAGAPPADARIIDILGTTSIKMELPISDTETITKFLLQRPHT